MNTRARKPSSTSCGRFPRNTATLWSGLWFYYLRTRSPHRVSYRRAPAESGPGAQPRPGKRFSAVIEERARLSRELHDGFAQLVAYMLLRLDTVTALVATNPHPEAL